jgi:hypothetical protein
VQAPTTSFFVSAVCAKKKWVIKNLLPGQGVAFPISIWEDDDAVAKEAVRQYLIFCKFIHIIVGATFSLRAPVNDKTKGRQ